MKLLVCVKRVVDTGLGSTEISRGFRRSHSRGPSRLRPGPQSAPITSRRHPVIAVKLLRILGIVPQGEAKIDITTVCFARKDDGKGLRMDVAFAARLINPRLRASGGVAAAGDRQKSLF
jgi:hypothetical protein